MQLALKRPESAASPSRHAVDVRLAALSASGKLLLLLLPSGFQTVIQRSLPDRLVWIEETEISALLAFEGLHQQVFVK